MTLTSVPDDDAISGEVVDRPRHKTYKLTGHRQQELLRDLAIHPRTLRPIARKYGITYQAVEAYRVRHAETIASIRADLADEFAGVWAAQKRKRIASLQWMMEIMIDAISDYPDTEMMRAYLSFEKQIADELGQMPTRTQVVSAKVTHVIEGISDSDLSQALK